MILDTLGQVTLTFPTSGNYYKESTAIDLLPMGGNGSPIFDANELIVARFRVTTAYTAGAGTPGVQLHVVAAENAALTLNPVCLGTAAGTLQLFGGRFGLAFSTAALVASASLGTGKEATNAVAEIPLPTINDLLNPGQDFRKLRYLGALLTVINYDDAGPPALNAGAMTVDFCLRGSYGASRHRQFPSAMVVK